MKNIEEQLNILQKTTMNSQEKGVVRGAVVSYMQENPLKTVTVRNSEDSRLHYRTAQTPNINNNVITKTRMIIAIIIALMLGGGTSFAAENALPGDVLYPIKIHVNENVQELVAVSDEAGAKVQAKLATRRLEEAEKLAVNGRLNAETSADLKARFEDHSEKSKEHHAKVKEGNNADAAANISSDTEVSLGTHEKLLEDIEDAKPEMKGFLEGILGGVQLHLKEAGDDRLDIEAKVFANGGSDAKAAAEGTLNAAQNKIDEVKKFIESRKDTLSASVQAEVGVHVKAADAAMAEGKAKIEAQAYADAFALFKKAAREAQTAQLFATTGSDLKIELKNHNESRPGSEGEGRESSTTREDKTIEHKDNNEAEVHSGAEKVHGDALKIETKGDAETHTEEGDVLGGGKTKINLGL